VVPPQGPPNIILISVDGLRADRTGWYGNPNQPTPTFDALAAEGVVFERAFSQSNESLFSHAALFTGRYVSELASPDYRTFVLPDEALTAAEILGLYGYTTGAFAAGGHVRGAYGFDQGFSVYEDEHDFGAFFHTAPAALGWVRGQARAPFFLFLHGYDCHRPYHHAGPFYHAYGADYAGEVDALMRQRSAPERVFEGVYYPDFPVGQFAHAVGDPIVDPDGYLRIRAHARDVGGGVALSARDIDHLRDHYDGGVLAADLQIGAFLEALQAEGHLDNALVVYTSDHGEDLHDHGFFNHRAVLRDSTTQVPLALWGAAVPEALRGSAQGGLAQAIDVLPTILAAAGAAAPAALSGRDLLGGAPAPSVIFQEGVLDQVAARSEDARLVFSGVPLAFAGFDLALAMAPMEAPWFARYATASDPLEVEDTLPGAAEAGEGARGAMLDWRQGLEPSDAVGAPPDDPALRAILRSRGYW